MKRFLSVTALVLLIGAGLNAKEYLADWQSADRPEDPSKIVTIPEFPEEGRKFEVRRTYLNKRPDRAQRRTPPDGYIEILQVTNGGKTLKFLRDGKWIFSIKLGRCFSFAEMDRNHKFENQGSASLSTAPPDCTIWDGRKWNQTYRTLVGGWHNPCVYEAQRVTHTFIVGESLRFRSTGEVHMTMEKNGKTYDWENFVVFDTDSNFFSDFNVGYIGRVEILREITDQ